MFPDIPFAQVTFQVMSQGSRGRSSTVRRPALENLSLLIACPLSPAFDTIWLALSSRILVSSLSVEIGSHSKTSPNIGADSILQSFRLDQLVVGSTVIRTQPLKRVSCSKRVGFPIKRNMSTRVSPIDQSDFSYRVAGGWNRESEEAPCEKHTQMNRGL